MAGTYFKYAERNVDSQINWAEIGKNVTDMLREENRLREEKKDALDAASRESLNRLANSPTGEFQSANEWTLNYASDASQALLMQDRLLKNGLLKVKDYTVMRQNLNDGTNQLFQVAKEYQAQAADIMKRYKGDENQDIEAWMMEQVEGLSNFKNTKAYINPTNFTVSLGMMKKKIIDGKEVMVMDDNPDNYFSINQLRNRMNQRFDRYKYIEAVDKQVAALGEYQTADISKLKEFYKVGTITEITDPTVRERLSDEDEKTLTAYEEWETNTIGAELSNPFHVTSLLTNAIDKVPGTQDYYEPTFDAELAKTNPKYILLEDDGSGMIKPKFTPEQEKAAQEFLRAQIRNSLDRKISQRTFTEPQPPQPSQVSIEARKEQASTQSLASSWNSIFTAGTIDEKERMAQIILGDDRSKELGLTDIVITETSDPGTFTLEFKYASSPDKNRSITINENTTLRDWAGLGSEIHGVSNPNEAIRLGGGGDGSQKITTSGFQGGFKVKRAGVTPSKDYSVAFDNYLNDSFAEPGTNRDNYTLPSSEKVNLYNNADIVVPQLKNAFSNLNLIIRKVSDNQVQIKVPGTNAEKTFSVNLSNERNQKAVIKEMVKLIEENTPKATVSKLGDNLGWQGFTLESTSGGKASQFN